MNGSGVSCAVIRPGPAFAGEPRSIGEILEFYLAVNAHPRNEGGLAPSTYERYESIVGCHMLGKPRARGCGVAAPTAYAAALSSVPAVRFNEPRAPSAWREQMLREGVPKPMRRQAWRVLSAALSWAAASQLVPEIEINGCRLATEPRGNKRRSLHAGGTGYAPRERRGSQYGLSARNQEVWGLRWSSLVDEFAWVLEVLSCGRLDQWGKTEHSTQRRTAMPGILREDLSEWRTALGRAGHPARERDFIIPGDLAGVQHGIRDPHTGATTPLPSERRIRRTKPP